MMGFAPFPLASTATIALGWVNCAAVQGLAGFSCARAVIARTLVTAKIAVTAYRKGPLRDEFLISQVYRLGGNGGNSTAGSNPRILEWTWKRFQGAQSSVTRAVLFERRISSS